MKFPVSIEATAYKNLRLAAGLSATEAAAILGVTPETLSRRENGKTPITQEAWLALEHVTEEALQIAWSYLAARRDEGRHDEAEDDETEDDETEDDEFQECDFDAPLRRRKRKAKQIQPDEAQPTKPPPPIERKDWKPFGNKAVRRNDTCSCGSGNKFKRCCGR